MIINSQPYTDAKTYYKSTVHNCMCRESRCKFGLVSRWLKIEQKLFKGKRLFGGEKREANLHIAMPLLVKMNLRIQATSPLSIYNVEESHVYPVFVMYVYDIVFQQ